MKWSALAAGVFGAMFLFGSAGAATLDVVVIDEVLDKPIRTTIRNDGQLTVRLGGFTTRPVRDLHVRLPQGVTFGSDFLFLVGGTAPAFVTDFAIRPRRIDALVSAPLQSGLDGNGDLVLNNLFGIELNGMVGQDIRVTVIPTTTAVLPTVPLPASVWVMACGVLSLIACELVGRDRGAAAMAA
jgi:hypothetical protein